MGRSNVNQDATSDWETIRPTANATSRSATPKTVTSPIRPGRNFWRVNPIKKAIGIVIAIVNVPQAFRYKAFTTASPNPANATTTMNSTATAVAVPVITPTSSRAISGNDRPLRRIEATRMMKS